jgi:hypothetical protein
MSTLATDTSPHTRRERLVLQIADTCFEMFSIKELKRPVAILHEIAISFPEASALEIQEAISLAISWRRALRNVAGLAH